MSYALAAERGACLSAGAGQLCVDVTTVLSPAHHAVVQLCSVRSMAACSQGLTALHIAALQGPAT